MLWNYEVCDNKNAMKQCNFQNNYGVIAYRKVCGCAPIFRFSYGIPKFFSREKNTIFGDFWDRNATFLKLQW